MKITLKKVLYCGFALLILICFFLTLVLPITLNVGGASYSGTFLSVINEGHGLDEIFRSDVLCTALTSKSSTTLSEMRTAVDVLRTTYSIVGTIGLVMLIVCLLATVGAFFIPSMKGARGLTIPFFAIGLIFFLVLSIFGVTLGQVTVAYAGDASAASASYAGILFAAVAFILFLAMMIVPGVVHEKVLVGKKEEK